MMKPIGAPCAARHSSVIAALSAAAFRLSMRLAAMLCIPSAILFAQSLPQYTASKIAAALTIDGALSEPEWTSAPFSSKFIHIADGSAARLSTQVKFLWDERFLYIGFECEDQDVWATMTRRDDNLWKGEVVEIFCDPDGDGLNYCELEINPLGTLMDLTMTKAYTAGGRSNLSWNLNYTAAIKVEGTLNDSSDADRKWTCEVAIPFGELAFMAPSLHFPPKEGETWRIMPARYDYQRKGTSLTEISAWSQTNSSTFHVPERFGVLGFAGAAGASGVKEEKDPKVGSMLSGYPNPFNGSNLLHVRLPNGIDTGEARLQIFSMLGQRIKTFDISRLSAEQDSMFSWDGTDDGGMPVAGGTYFAVLTTSARNVVLKLMFLK